MASEAIVICLLLSWRDSLSKVSVWWSWLWNVVWPVKNVICLLLSWRNCLDRNVIASETIVICLLLLWRDSFRKLSVWWSWLWNVVWPVKNVVCLLLSWRNCLDKIDRASEAIVICLLLSWRNSFSKVSVWWSWLWNVVWPVKNVICLLLSRRNCLDRIVMACEAIVICLLLSWRDSLSKVSVWWSWLWTVVWPVKNVICLLLSWRNCFHRIVIASETIVIRLLLLWRDSFRKLSVWWSWLWNVKWPVKNVVCLLLSWRNCLDKIVMASEAIVICLLLSRRDSFSKLSV